MGQRGAAEATRMKFKLETFSHSTVSRSFRSFEQARKHSLEKKYGAEISALGAERPMLVDAAAKIDANEAKEGKPEKLFPMAIDTVNRREWMRGFFHEFPSVASRADIEKSSIRFVEKWHKKTGRLLL